MVREWLIEQPGVTEFIDQQARRIITQKPASVVTTCTAGKHRSVMIAEALAQKLRDDGIEAHVTHKELDKRKRPARDDGMGWRHQKQRERLRAQLKDGTPCWWCGRPMHRDQDLHADHSESRKYAGVDSLADRLLHGACNEQRQQGDNDDRRPLLGAPNAFTMLPIRLKAGGTDPRFHPHDRAASPPEPFTADRPFTWG